MNWKKTLGMTCMAVIFAIVFTGLVVPVDSASAKVRNYWIKAEAVEWDFAPSFPINLMTGEPFTEDQLIFVDPAIGIGHIYTKAVYCGYSEDFGGLIDGPVGCAGTTTETNPRTNGANPDARHLGILGPIIRGEVGDTIIVHFQNATDKEVSLHPHGVFYDKNSEGAPYEDGTDTKGDDIVPAGGSHTYTWPVPNRAGPGPSDPSSIMWPYHSHRNETADTNGGLVGAIIITRRGLARADGSPRLVNREFVSLFTVFDENSSLFIDDNIAGKCGGDPTCGLPDEEFEESNLMHGINGLLWGNNDGYNMSVGERVRWYVWGMGTEVDLHTPHWHGVTLLQNGNRVDVTEVFPASAKNLTLRPDNPGKWMFHCHVNDHLDAGMMTTFTAN